MRQPCLGRSQPQCYLVLSAYKCEATRVIQAQVAQTCFELETFEDRMLLINALFKFICFETKSLDIKMLNL